MRMAWKTALVVAAFGLGAVSIVQANAPVELGLCTETPASFVGGAAGCADTGCGGSGGTCGRPAPSRSADPCWCLY